MTRSQIKKLQNKVIKKLEKEGYTDQDRLTGIHYPNGTNACLKDLRDYIWPAYVPEFKNFLS